MFVSNVLQALRPQPSGHSRCWSSNASEPRVATTRGTHGRGPCAAVTFPSLPMPGPTVGRSGKPPMGSMSQLGRALPPLPVSPQQPTASREGRGPSTHSVPDAHGVPRPHLRGGCRARQEGAHSAPRPGHARRWGRPSATTLQASGQLGPGRAGVSPGQGQQEADVGERGRAS